MYTNEQILILCDSCDFEETHEDNWYEKIIENLNFEASGIPNIDFWDAGASKVVFGWHDQDVVVKIPMRGYWSEYDDFGGYIEEFISFEGANNSENSWNYCQTELENYQKAKIEGVEIFFPEIWKIGATPTEKFPIYLQIKIDSPGACYIPDSIKISPAQKDKAIDMSSNSPIAYWEPLALALVDYGEEITERLCNFINYYEIGDLHLGNLGLFKNKFVIFDYSGFNDACW